MHAVHLPTAHLRPRQWRLPALAALIAVLSAAVLFAGAQSLGDRGAGAPRADAAAQAAGPAGGAAPAWVRDPLTPPTTGLAGAR